MQKLINQNPITKKPLESTGMENSQTNLAVEVLSIWQLDKAEFYCSQYKSQESYLLAMETIWKNLT
jgi:hypothetical protein